MNLLYVEDCANTIELFQFVINKHCGIDNLSLDVAGTVLEAIQLFSAEKHNAALIDWNLPDGNGIDVAQHIRSMHETLPIIFLSAALRDDHVQAAEIYRPKACLTKKYGKGYIDNLMRLILID